MAALKALVIFMGVLIVVGAGTLGYVVMTRMAATEAANKAVAEAAKQPAPLPFNRAMTIPAGAEVESMTGVGDKLVLRIGGPAMQTRLLMIDAAHGTLLGTLDLIPMTAPVSPPVAKPAPASEEK
jgi:hypothetical protein